MIVVFVLSGCGSPGPMETYHGPVNTPVFKPVILDTIKDGSKDVHFKERGSALYLDKERDAWGTFFITDNGVYMTKWSASSFTFSLIYKIKIQDIESVTDDIVIRDFLPDSKLLVIKDKRGDKVGFALNDKVAAKNTILDLMEKN